MESKRRVLIVEDHTLLRVGLRALLERESDIEIAGEAGNGRDAIRLVSSLSLDLILMDLTLPGVNGVEAITEIKRRNPEIRILVLTLHRAEEYVQQSLKAGADGYILKDATHDELRVAIRSVLNGKTYLSPDISSKIISGYLGGNKSASPASVWETVTHRERQILKLVAEGLPNKSIASYLSLSVKTVEKHRSNLMKKLDLHNASMLTAYAFAKGLVVSESGVADGTAVERLRDLQAAPDAAP
jgi:DNA-binding NarL/FixJ family response regulator